MSACTCGTAACALDRKKGGTCPGPHETPKRHAGAATPTSSKFAAFRRKIAGALKLDLPGPALSPLPKAPSFSMGSTAVTRASAPATGDAPTSPKLSSYEEIRRRVKTAVSSRFVGLPPRTRAGAGLAMSPADIAKHKLQQAPAPHAAATPLQPSGGQMFDLNLGDNKPLELARPMPGLLRR